MKVGRLAIKAFIGFGIMVGTVACGESGAFGPTSPSALPSGSSEQSSTAGWSTRDESRVPPIRIPAGVTCPSDAPNIIASATDGRLDIEWSFIPMVGGYEVVIERYDVTNVWGTVHTAKVNSTRYEWRGTEGSKYRVRVRSIRCGDTGLWSSYVYVSLDGQPYPAPKQPSVEEPDCQYSDYSTRGSSRTQTSMPCDKKDDDDSDCESINHATRYSSRTQMSMPCDEEPNCEYTDYSARGSSQTQTYMPCDEEEEPHCEKSSYSASARGSARTQTFMPCGWSWDRARVRR